MSARLTVAINAQINPRTAGGTESALKALIRHLGGMHGPEQFLLLATRSHAREFTKLMASNQALHVWRFPLDGYVAPGQLVGRWERLRQQAGALAPGVHLAHGLWRRFHEAASPSADETDLRLRARGASVVHFPYGLHFDTSLPFVYEPWDLLHRHYPEFFSPEEWLWRDQTYRRGCERAALVITSTQWTKRDVVETYGIDSSKVAVIPRGPSVSTEARCRSGTVCAQMPERLPDFFAFYPAMTFPHKNHVRLLEALALLRDGHGIALPLVCTGRIYEPHWPAVAAAVARLRLETQVQFLGVVTDEMLCRLYASAGFLVFPSLFEGLGLPVLEAMQAGLPIVSSDATCLPEVAGDAALFFDPQSTQSIADALLTAVKQPDMLAAMRGRAATTLARHSWSRAAATFVTCYRAVAGLDLTSDQQQLLSEALPN